MFIQYCVMSKKRGRRKTPRGAGGCLRVKEGEREAEREIWALNTVLRQLYITYKSDHFPHSHTNSQALCHVHGILEYATHL